MLSKTHHSSLSLFLPSCPIRVEEGRDKDSTDQSPYPACTETITSIITVFFFLNKCQYFTFYANFYIQKQAICKTRHYNTCWLNTLWWTRGLISKFQENGSLEAESTSSFAFKGRDMKTAFSPTQKYAVKTWYNKKGSPLSISKVTCFDIYSSEYNKLLN